jgi:hypothetical protein
VTDSRLLCSSDFSIYPVVVRKAVTDSERECITTVETEAPVRDGTDIPIVHDQLNNSYYPATA